ncbi:hypothetical protein EC950183_0930, partial [Escherichia coli 95.0183]
MFLSD